MVTACPVLLEQGRDLGGPGLGQRGGGGVGGNDFKDGFVVEPGSEDFLQGRVDLGVQAPIRFLVAVI